MKLKGTRRLFTVTAAATALLLALSSIATADIVTNDVDTTIDVALEDFAAVVGANSTAVTLSALAADLDDPHESCNIEGGPNDLVLDIVSSNPAVATVTGPGGSSTVTFLGCDLQLGSTQALTIVGLVAGTTTITFPINHALTSNSTEAGPRTWSVSAASFTVTVAGGGASGENTYCDDPAAPAWANHILKANQRKNKKLTDPRVTNYVAQVAQLMGPGTDFQSNAKTSHTAYEFAVRDYLAGQLGTTLVMPTGWPPLSCTTVN